MKRVLMISGLLVTLLALPGAAQRGMRGCGMGMGGGMRGGAMGTGGMQNGSMRGNRSPGDSSMQRYRAGERQGMQRGQNRETDQGGRHKQKRARGRQQDGAVTEQN